MTYAVKGVRAIAGQALQLHDFSLRYAGVFKSPANCLDAWIEVHSPKGNQFMTDMSNPYQPPSSRVANRTSASAKPVPAERWRRFVNMLVDTIVLYVSGVALIVVVGLIGGMAAINKMQGIPSYAAGFVIGLSYFVAMEAWCGRTVGKFLTGTRVVDEKGKTPSTGQILGRSLARYVPLEPFSFFAADVRGWHDKWSGTLVVRNS